MSVLKINYKDKVININYNSHIMLEETILQECDEKDHLNFRDDFKPIMDKFIEEHNLKLLYTHPAVGGVYTIK